jgi:hypothetical protein
MSLISALSTVNATRLEKEKLYTLPAAPQPAWHGQPTRLPGKEGVRSASKKKRVKVAA